MIGKYFLAFAIKGFALVILCFKEWFPMANSLSGHTLRLFLVYINDLPEGLTRSAKLFADDTLMIL